MTQDMIKDLWNRQKKEMGDMVDKKLLRKILIDKNVINKRKTILDQMKNFKQNAKVYNISQKYFTNNYISGVRNADDSHWRRLKSNDLPVDTFSNFYDSTKKSAYEYEK